MYNKLVRWLSLAIFGLVIFIFIMNYAKGTVMMSSYASMTFIVLFSQMTIFVLTKTIERKEMVLAHEVSIAEETIVHKISITEETNCDIEVRNGEVKIKQVNGHS